MSLTKIFSRLRNHGKMAIAAGTLQSAPQAQIVLWLKERYEEFVNNLIALLESGKPKLEVSVY